MRRTSSKSESGPSRGRNNAPSSRHSWRILLRSSIVILLILLSLAAVSLLVSVPMAPAAVNARTAGAPPGYGLSDSSQLVARGPIFIGSDGQFTSANGVRGGDGTAGNPYIISNWLIDMSKYPGASTGIWLNGTTKYAVIENNKVKNLDSSIQWQGIQLGQFPYIVLTQNVIIRNNEIQSRTAFGIALREGTTSVRVEANLVTLNAARNWTYGIMTDRGVHDVTLYGNYVNAYSLSYLTVGIQVGDYRVSVNRRVTDVVVASNTVVNATCTGLTSDDTLNLTVKNNLVFNDYPGFRKIGTWPVRGIFVEELSNYTLVYGNEIYQVENGIDIAAGLGTYFGNTIHDASYAVYINDNNSFSEARWTLKDTVYDTTYWSIGASPLRVPTTGYHTILDIRPGITPSNFGPVFFTANQSVSRAVYLWAGQQFNLSITLGTRVVYDHQQSTYSQSLQGTWSGSGLKLQVSRFTPDDVAYTLQSSTAASFSGAGFEIASYYTELQAGQTAGTAVSNVSGYLRYDMPSPVSGSYELRLSGSFSPPTIAIVAPTNGSYVNTSDVSIQWIAVDTGPGLESVQMTVDDNTTVNVTGSSAWTAYGLPDGLHSVRITVTDQSGLAASHTIVFTVNTQSRVATIVGSINYQPDASLVDIKFTQPMNQTSVNQALALSPGVNYTVSWVNASSLRVQLQGPLVQGQTYQLVLGSSAKTAGGALLQQPFVFQFVPPGSGVSAGIVPPEYIPIGIVLVVVALVAVNWVTAGMLVAHYRRNTKRMHSALTRANSRYRGSLVIVVKRLARPSASKANGPRGIPKEKRPIVFMNKRVSRRRRRT